MDSKTMDCPSCGQLTAQMKEDSSISHRQYDQLLQKLMELERQGDMELYAGDCPLEDTGAVLDAEQHYTDRKSTRLNSSHSGQSRMPSSA